MYDVFVNIILRIIKFMFTPFKTTEKRSKETSAKNDNLPLHHILFFHKVHSLNILLICNCKSLKRILRYINKLNFHKIIQDLFKIKCIHLYCINRFKNFQVQNLWLTRWELLGILNNTRRFHQFQYFAYVKIFIAYFV